MANFAIKDSVDFTLKKAGQSSTYLDVDFVNSGSLSVEGDTTYARKKGSNAIAFPNAKKATFTVEAEVANWKWLALQMGGELTGADGSEVLTIKGITDSQSFSLSGTFDVAFDDGTPNKTMAIEMGNVSPQSNAEITFSTDEVTGFKITFDVMVDSKGDLLIMKPYDESEM